MNPRCNDRMSEPAPMAAALLAVPGHETVGGGAAIDRNGGGASVNLKRMAVGDSVNSSACGGCPMSRPLCHAGQCVVPTCANMMEWCDHNSLTGLRVRTSCPVTCGCDQPRSPLTLSTPVSGCSATCVTSPRFRDALAAMPCTDSPTTGNFSLFLNSMLEVSRAWPSGMANNIAYVQPLLKQHGCGYLVTMSLIGLRMVKDQFCFGGLFSMKPLSYFCPHSCGCSAALNVVSGPNDARRHCPASCAHPNATSAG